MSMIHIQHISKAPYSMSMISHTAHFQRSLFYVYDTHTAYVQSSLFYVQDIDIALFQNSLFYVHDTHTAHFQSSLDSISMIHIQHFPKLPFSKAFQGAPPPPPLNTSLHYSPFMVDIQRFYKYSFSIYIGVFKSLTTKIP